eukprot:7957839-Pyramimonas_sp.AAC.1
MSLAPDGGGVSGERLGAAVAGNPRGRLHHSRDEARRTWPRNRGILSTPILVMVPAGRRRLARMIHEVAISTDADQGRY